MTSVKELNGFYDLYSQFGDARTTNFFKSKLKGLDLNQLHIVHQIAKRHLEGLNGIPSLPNSFSEVHSLISGEILSGARLEVNERVDELSNNLDSVIFEYFKKYDPQTSRKFRRIEKLHKKFDTLKRLFRFGAKEEYEHIEKASRDVEEKSRKLEQKAREISSDVCLSTDTSVYGEYPQSDLQDENRRYHIDKTINEIRGLKKRVFGRIKRVKPKLGEMIERWGGSLERYLTLRNIHERDEPQEWYLVQSALLKICSEDHDISECPRLARYKNPSRLFKAQMGVYAAFSPEMIAIYSFNLANKIKGKLS